MYQQKLGHIRPNLFPSSKHQFPQIRVNMSASPSLYIQIPSASSSSLLSPISPRTWMISFGKYLSLSLDTSSTNSPLQPDLQYYLSLGARSPLVISQSQTPKAHTIMGNTKRTAMKSTSKLSTIAFGLAFYCELYFPSPEIHHLDILILPTNSAGDLGCNYPPSVNLNLY